MNKKVSLGVAVAFSAVIAAIVFSITMMFSQDLFNKMISNDSQREEIYDKITKIDTVVDSNFLLDVDEQNIIDMVGKGYIAGLNDKYATYLTKEEYEEKILDDDGALVGIGITATQDVSGYVKIVSVTEGSPAEASGLKVDDLIVNIEGQDVLGLGWEESVKALRGEEGTIIKLTARRDSVDAVYEMARKKMEVISVEYKMIDDNAYIKIEDFNSATVTQFEKALSFAEENSAKGLIFDLRDNPGGTMDSVCDMLDMLVGEGTLVTVTDSSGKTEVLAESDEDEVTTNMICITNSNTASAAELFVSVLKDYEKAESVGTTTFGKGVMQTTYPLSDGSAVKITTAYFNPPISENFNGVGVKPEYEVILKKDEEDKVEVSDETKDSQLIKAIEVVSSKVQ